MSRNFFCNIVKAEDVNLWGRGSGKISALRRHDDANKRKLLSAFPTVTTVRPVYKNNALEKL
jgi:hypothetical protein